MTLSECVQRLLEISDREERYSFLCACVEGSSKQEIDQFAESLKNKVTDLIHENTERAIDLADCIRLLSEITGDGLHRALGLRVMGLALVQGKGDFQGALPLYHEAASIHQAHGDRLGEALVYLNEIWALGNVGRSEEAIQKGEWAKKTFEEFSERFLLGKVCNNLALVYCRMGEFRHSLDLLEQASVLYQEFGRESENLLSSAENNRALNLVYIGHYREAIKAGEMAVQLSENLNQPIASARAKHSLGLILSQQGHFTRALVLYDEARRVHEAHHQLHEAALCQLSAMGCLGVMRRFDEVIEINHEIQPVFHQLKMYHEEGQAFLFCANSLTAMGKREEAISAYQTARQIFEQEGNKFLVGRCDLERAKLYLQMDELSISTDLAEQCALDFHTRGLTVYYAHASLIIAQAALKSGDIQKSERVLKEIRELLKKNKWEDWRYRCFQISADISRQQNQFDEAFDYLEQAIFELEQLRGNIMLEYRSGFIEDKQNAYSEMVDLCLEREIPEKGFRFAERAKSRALLELLAYRPDMSIQARDEKDSFLVAELMTLREHREARLRYGVNLMSTNGHEVHAQVNLLQQEVRAIENKMTALWHRLLTQNADYARDASLWEVRPDEFPQLDAHSILVEFFSIKDQWVVFVISPGLDEKKAVRAIRLAVTSREIEDLLQRFKVNLGFVPRSSPPQMDNLIHNAQKVLRQLYELLFAPITPLLSDFPNLIIVPHGPLHYLPFHALFDGDQYLVEKFQISYLPAAGVLHNHQEHSTSHEYIMMGHSFNGRLPHAVEEARRVARLWDVEAICDEDASPQILSSRAENSRLIHLACHGDFHADNPLFSGLALENGWLTTLDVFNLRLKASLVTLSACMTGRSVIGGGDELFGLMRAFLSAGAASLLLTHWPVSDESTAWFMENFYRTLKDGATKGAALRAIQRQFLSKENENLQKYRHPYYWAPFFLVGQDDFL